MTEEKVIALVHMVDARTGAGHLKWEKTATDFEFQTTLSSFVIRIGRFSTREEPDCFVVSLVDKSGTELESISDRALMQMVSKTGMILQEGTYTLMERIFTNAKRQALGVDKAIDDILTELGGSPPP